MTEPRWPRLAMWFSYPFSKLVPFMEETRFRIFGHVIVLGPIAFAVIWRKPETANAMLKRLHEFNAAAVASEVVRASETK